MGQTPLVPSAEGRATRAVSSLFQRRPLSSNAGSTKPVSHTVPTSNLHYARATRDTTYIASALVLHFGHD